MSETLPIYRHFDVSVKHQSERAKHYVPPKTRDEAERARRHELAKGTIILEHQQIGLGIASLALKFAKRPDDIDFTTRVLAAGGFNLSWYAFARGAELAPQADKSRQRRRLELPDLTIGAPENRLASEDLRYEAAWLFEEAMRKTAEAIDALPNQPKKFHRLSMSIGRLSGKASLMAGTARLGDEIINLGGLTDADTQNRVRQGSLIVVDNSRIMGEDIGVVPSLAQLADPYSNVSVFWHRNAPNGAMNALEQAWDIKGIAA